MKFKQNDVQNQRLQKITEAHLVIGIDIAQEVHVARAVNYRGMVLPTILAFTNEEDGFVQFQHWLRKLQCEHRLDHVIVGMEPTGHYWFNLARWLDEQGVEVVVVNPYLVKKNKDNRDNSRSKNDAKDALVIADMIKNGYYTPVRLMSETFETLRVFMKSRELAVNRLVRVKNQIIRWLDIVFPEYRQAFADVFCQTSVATLHLFPTPQDLRNKSITEIESAWRTRLARSGGPKRAAHLIALAKRSIGSPQAVCAYRLQLQQLLEEYDLIQTQLESLDQEMMAVLKTIPFADRMLKISGLGPILVAAISAESGDLNGYAHGNALLRQAGLNLVENHSGKHRGKVMLSKRGRSLLRKYLYLAVICLVANNKEFKEMHKYNVEVKKMKRSRSLLKLCGKLARMLVGLAKNGESYKAEKVRPVSLAA